MMQPQPPGEPSRITVQPDWTPDSMDQAIGRSRRSKSADSLRALLARVRPILALYLLPTLVIGLELLHRFPSHFIIAAIGFVAVAHTGFVLFTETPPAIASRMRTLALLYGTAAAAAIAQQITGFDAERMLTAIAATAIGHAGFSLCGDLLAWHNPPHGPPWNDPDKR